jgi:hypothetical protein
VTTYVNDCRLDLEDRDMLTALEPIPESFATYSRPDEVLLDWHRMENQGPIGSCQGNSITSCLERLQHVRGGPVVELSRIFGYLATQRVDGLLGSDRGSTVSGGVKIALTHGCPPESLTGYPRQYPAARERTAILSQANYDAGQPYKAVSSWKVPMDIEATMNFIGGGGAINLGISWYRGIIPSDRVVKNFRPPSSTGGHAVAVLGYTREGNLRVANSHADGEFEITQSAWLQMLSHRWTAAIGIVGTPDPEPVDWSLF